MKNWFVVYTQPRNEEMASEHLGRQGFDVYFPRYRKTRSHARRRDVASAPLFSRYVFVGFDAMNAAWRSIRSTVLSIWFAMASIPFLFRRAP